MIAEHDLPAELGQERRVCVEDAPAERRQRGGAKPLQVTGKKDEIDLTSKERRTDGRVQRLWRGMRVRRQMMGRIDHNDLALNASRRARVENALERGPFMGGKDPDL
jgi:hypothetical protein